MFPTGFGSRSPGLTVWAAATGRPGLGALTANRQAVFEATRDRTAATAVGCEAREAPEQAFVNQVEPDGVLPSRSAPSSPRTRGRRSTNRWRSSPSRAASREGRAGSTRMYGPARLKPIPREGD